MAQLHVKANPQGNLGPSAMCTTTPYTLTPLLIPNKDVLVEYAFNSPRDFPFMSLMRTNVDFCL